MKRSLLQLVLALSFSFIQPLPGAQQETPAACWPCRGGSSCPPKPAHLLGHGLHSCSCSLPVPVEGVDLHDGGSHWVYREILGRKERNWSQGQLMLLCTKRGVGLWWLNLERQLSTTPVPLTVGWGEEVEELGGNPCLGWAKVKLRKSCACKQNLVPAFPTLAASSV